MSLSDLNTATAISLEPMFGSNFPGSATISGSGLASALAVGGTASATADAFLSSAISVGSLSADADSHALGGLALSIGAGEAKTSTQALPLGIAVALGMGENASAHKVIPVFTQDLIRVVMTENGPKFETDLFGKPAPAPAPAPVATTVSASTQLADTTVKPVSAAQTPAVETPAAP